MDDKCTNAVRLGIILGFIYGVLVGFLLFTSAYAEPQITFNTKDTSYGELLIIRGNGFTPDSEYQIILVTPNDLLIQLGQGLTKDGKIGITHPIEFDAMKGNYTIIIETENEKATSNFNFNMEIPTTKQIDTPYGGNVAPEIATAEKSNETVEIEPIIVKEIPSWVKEVFKMWASDQISDQELLNGIRYLVNINVIVVS